jgi:hypothetical protein
MENLHNSIKNIYYSYILFKLSKIVCKLKKQFKHEDPEWKNANHDFVLKVIFESR